jgi:DMSO reductase anchor subunit
MLRFYSWLVCFLLATGSFLNASRAQLSNPIILSGLVVEFLGTIWLVLSLNQRRKKQKF